jgi:hypothetical protein
MRGSKRRLRIRSHCFGGAPNLALICSSLLYLWDQHTLLEILVFGHFQHSFGKQFPKLFPLSLDFYKYADPFPGADK